MKSNLLLFLAGAALLPISASADTFFPGWVLGWDEVRSPDESTSFGSALNEVTVFTFEGMPGDPQYTFSFNQGGVLSNQGTITTNGLAEISALGGTVIRTFFDSVAGVEHPTTIGPTFPNYPDYSWTSSGSYNKSAEEQPGLFLGLRSNPSGDGVTWYYGYTWIFPIANSETPGFSEVWVREYGWNNTPNRIGGLGIDPAPEPGAAALSLLALGGLALRRSRPTTPAGR